MNDASTSPHEEITMAVASTVSEIQSASATTKETSTKKDSALGKDEFLKLLTTQLQYQDPTQPMSNTEMVAQLAQFSALEQMTNVNTNLTTMISGQGTSLETTAASMVGKTAVFSGEDVNLTQGSTATVSATLASAASNVTVVFKNSDGNTVRTIGEGACASGANTFTWDGLDDNGSELATGTYTVTVSATDSSGSSITVTQKTSATITGVVFNNGTPEFIAGGSTLQLSDISEIDQ
jgi:flagellar basal-body rod modification protein FlgD